MRPCTFCRSEDTQPLDQSILTRLVSVLGGDPQLHAWVCRLCRHVDFWVDEPAIAASPADELVEADGGPIPIPAT